MKWADCMDVYKKTYLDIHGHHRRFTRIGNRRKVDIWLELYHSYTPCDNIKRSIKMTLEMIKLHFIEHDEVNNLRIIIQEKAKNEIQEYLSRKCNLELNIGEELLDISTYYRSYKIISWLLRIGVNPFTYNRQGISAISRAFETGNTYLVSKYMSLKTREKLSMIEIYTLLTIKNQKIMKILGINKKSDFIYFIYKSKLQSGL